MVRSQALSFITTRTGWIRVSIMCLSGILGYSAGGLVSQWDNTIKVDMSAHCHMSVYALI